MKKEFMHIILNAGDDKSALTAEQHLAFIKKCEAYIAGLKEAGTLIAAQPIIREGWVLSKKDNCWANIPVDPGEQVQVGYYHILANDMEEAIKIAKDNPEFEFVPSASIEVRPIKMKEEETNFVYPKDENAGNIKPKMSLTSQLAKQFREVYFGGNWTAVNLRDSLQGISWQQATGKVDAFNTIAALVFHINYYVTAALQVLEGGPLDAHDKYSFDHPPIQGSEDWERMLSKTWADAEKFTSHVEQLPDSRLWENFSGEKYGNYYRNIQGIIEHTHYHLGQVVLLKKMLLNQSKKDDN
jgi:hypothetical protein